MPQYIDMTPSWSQVISMHWHMMQQVSKPSLPGRQGQQRFDTVTRNFASELLRMARAADQWNEYCQAQEIATGSAEQPDAKRINTLADSMEEEDRDYAEACLDASGMINR